MRAGGRLLGQIRDQLQEFTQVGMSFAEIEAEAQRRIRAAGAVPNFALVPKYHWATCIMKNDEVCHGIPTAEKKVLASDVITIDIGLLYQGFHLDTTTTFVMAPASPFAKHFVDTGWKSLQRAIAAAEVGSSIYDVSAAMQKTVERQGFGAVYQLTGHGIGRELHEEPAVPCIALRADKRRILEVGQTIAIEIMYTQGDPTLELDADGWTYRTRDHSLAGMMEETVLITAQGPEVLTRPAAPRP